MLKSFTVENSHCFGDSVTLDMSAELNGESLDEDGNPMPKQSEVYEVVRERKAGRQFGILPVAAIYGKNSSGKSRLLKLLGDIAKDILPNDMREREDNEPSSHVIHNHISFIINDCEYELRYSKAGRVITSETFTVCDLGKEDLTPQLIYDRHSTEYETLFPLGEELAHRRFDENWLWFTYLYWREDCGLIHKRMGRALCSLDISTGKTDGFDFYERLIVADKDSSIRTNMRHILKCLDPSIVGMRIIRTDPYNSRRELDIWHKRPYGSISEVPLNEDSEGVQRLAILLPCIIRALDEGSIYVCDGLDKDLHPIVFKQLVRMFNDPEINKRNAQLIFTAHDTIVLDSDLLRKDEVHIIDKDENLVSVVNRLDKFTYVKPYPPMEFDYRTGFYYSFPEKFWECHLNPGDENVN